MRVLSDADARALVAPADAIEIAAELFARKVAAGVETGQASAVRLEGGRLIAAATVDRELGTSALDAVVSFRDAGSVAVVLVLASDEPIVIGTVVGSWLAGLAAGATSSVGARYLARRGSRSVGVIGCGAHAEAQLACLRVGVPNVDRVVAYCRTRERLEAFCAAHGAEPGDYGKDAAGLDIVVTATTSSDPVLRGDWLHEGVLVCAAGTAGVDARELDNVVLERAAFVCCDSLVAARAGAGDLVEPIERGGLDWLEVHELSEVVVGEVEGRQSDTDIVVLKSVGLPALRLALAGLALERAGS